jgi:hypothetical protein
MLALLKDEEASLVAINTAFGVLIKEAYNNA